MCSCYMCCPITNTVNEMATSVPFFSAIGLIGTVLYAVFSSACLWRTYESWTVLRDVNHLKFVFHAAMSTFAVSEFLYNFAILLLNDYSIWGFAFHILGMSMFVVSYTSVIYLWGKTIGRRHGFAKRAGVAVVAINTVASVVGICFLCTSRNFDRFRESYTEIYLLLIVVFAVSLLLLTCGMLWYGVRLQQKLNSGIITDPIERAKKIAIVFRINTVLFVCNICFFMRVLALVGLATGIIWKTNYTQSIGILGWFVLSMWVPTLIPGCTLLFIMRVKEVQQKRWGHTGDANYSTTHLSHNGSSGYNPPQQIRASNSSYVEAEADMDLSDLQGLDGLIAEYPRNSDDSYILDTMSPIPGSF